MWIYSQSTGQLWDDEGRKKGIGYSGHDRGKNNPSLESVAFIGPIPRGDYEIGEPYDSERVGPLALPLTPMGHDCCGRTDFLIHGDSRAHPGKASRGCIIQGRDVRQVIHNSGDKKLRVIE